MDNSSQSQQQFPPQQNKHRGPFYQFGDMIGWIVFFGLALLIVLLTLQSLGIRF